MKNNLGRYVPQGFKGFISSSNYLNQKRVLKKEKEKSSKVVFLSSLSDVFDSLQIKDGMTLSFHHHLRNGDYVLNDVLREIQKRNIKNIHLAPSSIFPNNDILVDLIEKELVTNIHTNYLNGPVAKAISEGKLKGLLIMNTHGGRARSIESKELPIDVAFLACPTVDKNGNGTGKLGKSACGTLGYAMSDLKYAKRVVLVTDTIVDELDDFVFSCEYVDYVVKVDAIGDPKGIVSGTTKITKDPVGLKIARDTASLLKELGIIKPEFSMQTGAGGTSLAVAYFVKQIMIKENIRGSFASGGITGYYTDMLEQNLFSNLYDVQCFDLEAVKSYRENINHLKMSASEYGNPFEKNVIVNKLDFVILGATEIDLDFNVNVTTDSYGNIIGGSGGHSDTAHGAKITIITTNLVKSRLPIIKNKVTTITTPGEDIDILVTERGIAINPKRQDLLEKLKKTKLNIVKIEDLMALAHQLTGVPKDIIQTKQVVGLVEYRDGTIIDCLYKIK